MAKLTMGEFLSVLRKAKGLTQESVAEQLGVSSKSVSSWENSRTYPDIMLLPVIAELYGVSVDELVRGERFVAEENTERNRSVSDESYMKIRKRKFADFTEKRTIFSIVACVSACISVLGCYLMCFVATWTLVFAILGLLGVITGILLTVRNQKKYTVGEGVILPEDITEENSPTVLVASCKSLLAFLLGGLPYLLYGAVVWLIYCFNHEAYTYELPLDVAIDVTNSVLTVGGITLFLGLGCILYATVKRARLLRRLGDETQRETLKKNKKLLTVLALPTAAILLLTMLIGGVRYLVRSNSVSISNLPFDNFVPFDTFEEFRDYMQTVMAGTYYHPTDTYFSRANTPEEEQNQNYTQDIRQTETPVNVPQTVLSIPEGMMQANDSADGVYYTFVSGLFDCGNSFFILVTDTDCIDSYGNPVKSASLLYRVGGSDHTIMDLSNSILVISCPNEEKTGFLSKPVLNMRFTNLYVEPKWNLPNAVTTIKCYHVTSAGNEILTSVDVLVAEYQSKGAFAGKYGIFSHTYYQEEYWYVCFLSGLLFTTVYTVVAVIIFLVKYKKQKIEILFKGNDKQNTHT